jgi:hypothetical protein
LTPDSARRIFNTAFPFDDVQLTAHGNVLSACAFLYGLAAEDLTSRELDYQDLDYDVTITVRAVKNDAEISGPSGAMPSSELPQ